MIRNSLDGSVLMHARNVQQMTPVLLVPDLSAAPDGVDLLGFSPLFREGSCAYVSREGSSVRVLQSTAQDGEPFLPHRAFCSVDVRDVDAIAAEVSPRLREAAVDVTGPTDQVYNQRELMIRSPDGNVFGFGPNIP